MLALGACGGSTPAEGDPHDWLVIPDTRIGPVTGTSSESDLIALLGNARVIRREAHIGEGFCATGSALYPGTPDEVEVLWSDSTYTRPAIARVSGAEGRWRSMRGVRVGSSLAELEQIAAEPVRFSGFGWDYGGGSSWSEETPEGSALILLRLAPNPDSVARVANDPRYPEILGDRQVSSDHPLLRRLDVRVERMSVSFSGITDEHECARP